MYDSATIAQHLGADAARYAANKHRGGRNNASGATYEAYYAAARIASAMADALRSGDDGAQTYVEEQRLCFINDLIVERPAGRRHSQMKSGATTSWSEGEHPIETDFRMQQRLDQALGVVTEYELVVSDPTLRASLEETKPSDVAAELFFFQSALI